MPLRSGPITPPVTPPSDGYSFTLNGKIYTYHASAWTEKAVPPGPGPTPPPTPTPHPTPKPHTAPQTADARDR
jgi:hypothetical protein